MKKLSNNFFFIIGFLAILLFSGTIPATKMVLEIYSPLHVTALRASCATLLGIMYLGLLSMFIGNCLWSIALSRGGIAKIGQIQFLQPFITIFISYWLLSELIKKEMIFFACAVTVVVILGQRQRFLD